MGNQFSCTIILYCIHRDNRSAQNLKLVLSHLSATIRQSVNTRNFNGNGNYATCVDKVHNICDNISYWRTYTDIEYVVLFIFDFFFNLINEYFRIVCNFQFIYLILFLQCERNLSLEELCISETIRSRKDDKYRPIILPVVCASHSYSIGERSIDTIYHEMYIIPSKRV